MSSTRIQTHTGLGIVGTIARFKPVHNAHAAILETLCERAAHVKIGLGSSNVYDARSPFIAQESREMIELVLKPRFSNYSFIEIPDLYNGPRWREQALRLFGPLDNIVTANVYVEHLLRSDYAVIHPLALIPPERRVPVSGTMVRLAMARGEQWEHLVPDAVAAYVKERGLVERFRTEFGLATIAQCAAEAVAEVPSTKAPSTLSRGEPE